MKIGDKVKIISDGPYEGMTGKIREILGQKSYSICLDNFNFARENFGSSGENEGPFEEKELKLISS